MFKGHLCRKIDSFLFLIPFLANRHISKTSILASNLPKFLKMNLSRSGIDEIKTKLYTGIIYMCIKNYLLTYFLLASCECRNIMAYIYYYGLYVLSFKFSWKKFQSSYISDFERRSALKMYHHLHSQIEVGIVCNKDMHYLYVCIAKFEDSDIWFRQYRYKILSIPVYNFINTSIRFCQYRQHFQRSGKVWGRNRRF